jgi:hypothetical protein
MARRTQVTATIFDAEGFPFICFKGNPQDVADACAIYVLNVADPLGGTPFIELRQHHDEEEP